MAKPLHKKLLESIDVDRMADPFDAVPQVPDGVEARTDAAGLVRLRRSPPRRRGLGSLLGRMVRLERAARTNLDERGSFFWSQIDGRRDLHDVTRRLSERFGLSRADARAATVLFVKAMMTRGLLVLEVKRPAAAGTRKEAAT